MNLTHHPLDVTDLSETISPPSHWPFHAVSPLLTATLFFRLLLHAAIFLVREGWTHTLSECYYTQVLLISSTSMPFLLEANHYLSLQFRKLLIKDCQLLLHTPQFVRQGGIFQHWNEIHALPNHLTLLHHALLLSTCPGARFLSCFTPSQLFLLSWQPFFLLSLSPDTHFKPDLLVPEVFFLEL